MCVCLTEVVFPDESCETNLMATSSSQCTWPCSCMAVPRGTYTCIICITHTMYMYMYGAFNKALGKNAPHLVLR